MDTLLSSLKKDDLKTITDEVHAFFQDSHRFPNKLKLSIATASIIEEALAVLAGINSDDYITELRNKLDNLSTLASESKKKHSAHLKLDSVIRNDLGESDNKSLLSMDEQIDRSLKRLDDALKQIIELRDGLPMAQIVEKLQV